MSVEGDAVLVSSEEKGDSGSDLWLTQGVFEGSSYQE